MDTLLTFGIIAVRRHTNRHIFLFRYLLISKIHNIYDQYLEFSFGEFCKICAFKDHTQEKNVFESAIKNKIFTDDNKVDSLYFLNSEATKLMTLIENMMVDIFCSYSSSMTGRILPE